MIKSQGANENFKYIFVYYVRYGTCVNVDLLCYDFRNDSRCLLISVQSYFKSNQEFYRCKTASYEFVRTQKLTQAERGQNGIHTVSLAHEYGSVLSKIDTQKMQSIKMFAQQSSQHDQYCT